MTWDEFKDYLRKNLEDDQTFANSICSKFSQNTQYHIEFMLDWVTHLEQQSILL